MKKNFYFILFFTLLSCRESSTNSEKDIPVKVSKGDSLKAFQSMMKPSVNEDSIQDAKLLIKQKQVLGGYRVEFAYSAYNEEKYGFQNPGFLKVYKNNKMIFSDVFYGDSELYVLSLENLSTNKDKIFFTLNWGLEACDYVQTSRFYCITADDKVHKLGDYWAMSTGDGYSSRNYDYFFSQDNHNLIVVESLFFHEHDKKDISDTIVYTFEEDKFKVRRLSNHLKSAN